MRCAVTAAALLVMSIGSAWADSNPRGISIFRVNHTGKDTITISDVMDRSKPYIAIYTVDPPVSDCMSSKCWAVVEFFVYNSRKDSGQDITVECTAFSNDGSALGKALETPQLRAREVGVSSVVLRNINYAAVSQVSCEITKVLPNSY